MKKYVVVIKKLKQQLDDLKKSILPPVSVGPNNDDSAEKLKMLNAELTKSLEITKEQEVTLKKLENTVGERDREICELHERFSEEAGRVIILNADLEKLQEEYEKEKLIGNEQLDELDTLKEIFLG